MQLRSLGAAALAVAVLAAGTGVAWAGDDDDRRGGRNDTSSELRRAVTVGGIKQHETVLHLAGLATGGNRLSGTRGYDASALYVAHRAQRAGLRVSSFNFNYDLLELGDWKPPVLDVRRGERFIPGIAGSIPGGDFGSMVDSPSGDITAPIWAADLTIPSPAANTSTSGCEASDFAGMPQGAIVILQRGTCAHLDKWLNAQNAGAGAIIYINEGDSPGRTDPLWFLMTGSGVEIPITAAQIATVERLVGEKRHGLIGKTARFRIEFRVGSFPTSNVIAETRGGNPNKVIVVGAHLDSVGTGTGINDNGSGSSAILEIAEQLRGVYPRNKIRFMWFGAEESGLLGSEAYVASLPDAERRKIAAMLNFDMIGSPNFVRFVYDGDLSDSPPISEEIFAPEARPFSAEIENVFLDYFEDKRLANEPTDFNGRSDYGPFIAAGVPAGGLFTGAEGIKTPEQAQVYGGTAGEQYDPCYHLGCDGLFNLSTRGLDQMSDAAAHATITLAQMRDIPDRPAPSAQALRKAFRADAHDHPEPLAVDAHSR
jgi:Zn-dependent M28 family amino/carboxypeptidase